MGFAFKREGETIGGVQSLLHRDCDVPLVSSSRHLSTRSAQDDRSLTRAGGVNGDRAIQECSKGRRRAILDSGLGEPSVDLEPQREGYLRLAKNVPILRGRLRDGSRRVSLCGDEFG